MRGAPGYRPEPGAPDERGTVPGRVHADPQPPGEEGDPVACTRECGPRSRRPDETTQGETTQGETTRKETQTMTAALRDAGEPAPSFRLPNQDGTPIRLEDFRGHYLLLWWYPKADTPG